MPSLQIGTSREYSGHFSSAGRPAASTRVGRMSTYSTRFSENMDCSVTPGTWSSMGALWATSKFVYLSYSECSPM